MIKSTNCGEIEVIPQSTDLSICWFNAILTICLYSQGCRNVLMEISQTWNTKNIKILGIIKKFLHKYYYSSNDQIKRFYKKLNPEFILLEFLNTFDKDFIKINQTNINHILYDGWLMFYITMVFKALQIDYKDIIITKTHKYQDILDYVNISYILKTLKIDRPIKITRNVTIPNIIILSHKNYTNLNLYFDNIFNNTDIFENNVLEIKYDDTNLNEEFIYGNETYKLDACILRNYNMQDHMGHIIAGITCNGKRYVYDGLISREKKEPCKLFDFNWNINEDNSFNINRQECDIEDHDYLTTEDIKNYDSRNVKLFSFSRGARLLIYVREDFYFKDYYEDIIQKSFSSLTPTINKKNLLDIIYNFNDLPLIVKKLKTVYPNDKEEIEEIKTNIIKLRNFIYKKLKVKETEINKRKKSSSSILNTLITKRTKM